MATDYYSLKKIMQVPAQYYVIFSMRSNGKTYSVLKYALQRYFETGEQLGIVRRWDVDFVGATSMKSCYNSLMQNGEGMNDIAILSGGKYTGVTYHDKQYFLTVWDEETQKEIRTDKVIAYAFALTQMEHGKSGSYPNITTVLFDEFITRDVYLTDEFIKWQNTISTIKRLRTNLTIFMCGNTISKYACPYFGEMGLKHIGKMSPGDIDTYTYGNTGLTVRVEYGERVKKMTKEHDAYFAFDNPNLKLMTSGDVWEMDFYPHLIDEYKYKMTEILFSCFIIPDEETILQCDVVQHNGMRYMFIHQKTTGIRHPEKDIVYQTAASARPNVRRSILRDRSTLGQRIAWFFVSEKVFYQDNDIGEIVRAYNLNN